MFNDGSLVWKMRFFSLPGTTCYTQITGGLGTGGKSSFSISYKMGASLSMAENLPNVPKHCHGTSLRELSALVDTFKEPSIHKELEIEVVFCPWLKPLA
jgi:hypothetical protein